MLTWLAPAPVLPPEAAQPRYPPTLFTPSLQHFVYSPPAPRFYFDKHLWLLCACVFYPLCHSRGFPKVWTGTFTPVQAWHLLRCSVGPEGCRGSGCGPVGARPGREVLGQPGCSLHAGKAVAREGVGPMSPHAACVLSTSKIPRWNLQMEAYGFPRSHGSSRDLASGQLL